MALDPNDIPLGVFSLEAAEIIAAAINAAGSPPAGVTGDIQFNNAGEFAAAPSGLLSYAPSTGATQIITASGLTGMALEVPGPGQPEAIQILAQDSSNGGGTIAIESVGQMSFAAAEMDFDVAADGVFSIATENPNGSMQFGTPSSLFGIFGATPVTKPTVTGSKGGNAALTSVIAALVALGFITDTTT